LQDISDRRAIARVAKLELARLAGLPVDAVEVLADPLDRVGATPPLAALLAEAERRHPELRALEAERVAAVARASAARAAPRPAPTLELGVELLDPSTCDPTGSPTGPRCVGPRGALSFDLPVLNWNGGPVARGEAEARAAELKRAAAAQHVLS